MIYTFDHYELDTRLYELRCAGKAVSLEPRAFQALAYVIQHRDYAISKEELIEHLWPGQYMREWVLVQSVVKARRAIGDDGQAQRYIKTIMGYGYRFIAPVTERGAVAHPAPARVPVPQQPKAHCRAGSRIMAPQQESNELWWQELPLAGREQALALLHGLLGQVEESQGQIVLHVIRLGVAQTEYAKRQKQGVDTASDGLRSHTPAPVPAV